MYLGSSGHQNLKKELPEESLPPEPPKGSKVAICIRGIIYLGSSNHQNLKKKLPKEPLPTEAPKGLKVAICIRGIVSEAFRISTNHKKNAPGEIFLTRAAKRSPSKYLYKGNESRSSDYENVKQKIPERSSESFWKLPEL